MPSSFTRKKARILADLNQAEYTDKSPKGSVDAEILDLIDEINAFDTYVTTSSCAGRVAVFVEGGKVAKGKGMEKWESGGDEVQGSFIEERANDNGVYNGDRTAVVDVETDAYINDTDQKKAGPGGKGHGNQWLYVSHSIVSPEVLDVQEKDRLTKLFQLTLGSARICSRQSPRLIKLTFSPLILHVLCASLQAAKPLLAAAINAGFRESGVQSLKALEDEDAGVMLAIRTAGLGFDTVVGIVEETIDEDTGKKEEIFTSLVDESYLRICVDIINERFEWNVERRERLRCEIRRIKDKKETEVKWEDPEERRQRKRKAGIRLQAEKNQNEPLFTEDEDILENGLFLELD